MVELTVGLLIGFAGIIAGFYGREYWERWRAEQAAKQAKAASSAKRSASAKEAAQRRQKKAELVEVPTGPLDAPVSRFNGSGQTQHGEQA